VAVPAVALLAGHAVQLALPVVALNVFAGHATAGGMQGEPDSQPSVPR